LQVHYDIARDTMLGRAQIQLKYENMFLLFPAKAPQVTAAIPLVSWRTVDESLSTTAILRSDPLLAVFLNGIKRLVGDCQVVPTQMSSS
jgi:hypothetical protein